MLAVTNVHVDRVTETLLVIDQYVLTLVVILPFEPIVTAILLLDMSAAVYLKR